MAGLMTHQNKKLPMTMKMWMQFNVMPWISHGIDTVYMAQNEEDNDRRERY